MDALTLICSSCGNPAEYPDCEICGADLTSTQDSDLRIENSPVIPFPGVTGVTGVTPPGKANDDAVSEDSDGVTPLKIEGVTGVTDGSQIKVPDLPKRRGEVGRWVYRDATGQVIGAAIRVEPGKNGRSKDVLPFIVAGRDTGTPKWENKAFAEPRPLYGLDRLATRPDAGVLVVEGEKSADAAGQLFPEMVVVTWPGGSHAVRKADFSVLRGRDVLIWPDHDKPGYEAAEQIAKILNLNPFSGIKPTVRILRILDAMDKKPINAADGPTFEPRDGDLPAGWDAADAVEDGWTVGHIQLVLGDPSNHLIPECLKPQEDSVLTGGAEPQEKIPTAKFLVREDGLYYLEPNENGGFDETTICKPALNIAAQTRTGDSSDWGRLIEWEDADGKYHRWAMPMSLLQGDGADYRKELARGGLSIWPQRRARDLLTVYLQTWQVPDRALCVGKTGWHGDCFVLPDKTIGQGKEVILFQSETAASCHLLQKGTTDDWRNNVASLCPGNSRLVMAASLSFAAPLLSLVNIESGGLHLFGGSSIGKTTAARLGASVFGEPDPTNDHSYIQSWRSTDNGLEGIAAAHNGLPLVFDEIGQADARSFGESIYMLANGRRKARMDRTGQLRSRSGWRILFLSTGEKTSGEVIESGGKTLKAGQEIRMVAVPADTGKFGVFEVLPDGIPDGGAFADRIKIVTGAYHGAVGLAYLEHLAGHIDEAVEATKEIVRAFKEKYTPKGAHPQVSRVAERFAVIAAGGELATRWGLTGWPPGEAVKASKRCFDDWLTNRAGPGSHERGAMLSQVRGFLEAHGASRFERFGATVEQKIVNRVGFIRTVGDLDEYMIPAESFKEVCRGFNHRQVAALLAEIGALVPNEDGKNAQTCRLPGMGPTRTYIVTHKLWKDEL